MHSSESGSSRRLRGPGSAIAAVAVIGALAVGTALLSAGPQAVATAQTMPRATGMTTGLMPADFTEVIERVSPAVVNIQVTGKVAAEGGPRGQAMPKGMEEFFRRFFGEDAPDMFRAPPGQQPDGGGRAVQGLGSGFIVDPSGYVVTNNHVIGEASKITVTLQDGKIHDARVIGQDPETDLALVKIEAGRTLPHVSFSASPTPRPGTWVIAVGNPFGLDHTATAGIVSATGRAIGAGPYDDFLQIDAPINRGNSGGPTFNLKGEVVGVNTAIYSPSGGSIGIGFAIPASIARNVIDQLRERGHVERGWLGVEVQGITPDIAASLGLDEQKGALVARVMPDGPAAKSELRQGDLVLSVNDRPVEKLGDLTRNVADLRPGSTVKLGILRGGERRTVSVELGSRPRPEKVAGGAREAPAAGSAVLGMRLATLDAQARKSFGLADDVQGVVVTAVAPGSPAAEKGMQPGDVIAAVNNREVRNPRDVASRIEEVRKSGKKAVLMLVRSGSGDRFVAIPVGAG